MNSPAVVGRLERGVRRLARWWRGLGIPSGPQPCPHCGVQTVRAWAEGSGDNERFFVEHGEPLCPAGGKRLEIFPFTNREIQAFRHWTPNAEVQPGATVLRCDSAGTPD